MLFEIRIIWINIINPDDSVNHQHNNFLTIFLDNFNISCPILRQKIKSAQKPWLTSGLLKSISMKSKYFKLSLKNTVFSPLYKQYSNKLKMLIRQSKNYYYKQHFELLKNET